MTRALLTLLAGLLLLTGCARPAAPTVRTQTPPPRSDPSREVTTALESAYGDRLVRASRRTISTQQDRPEARMANLSVTLASGEPTGTEPFIALSALVKADPGFREYQVVFNLPKSRVRMYQWVPEERTVEYLAGAVSGMMGTAYLRGTASDITTSALMAIAAGDGAVPDFRDPKASGD